MQRRSWNKESLMDYKLINAVGFTQGGKMADHEANEADVISWEKTDVEMSFIPVKPIFFIQTDNEIVCGYPTNGSYLWKKSLLPHLIVRIGCTSDRWLSSVIPDDVTNFEIFTKFVVLRKKYNK